MSSAPVHAQSTEQLPQQAEAQWWEAFPLPRCSCCSEMTADELLTELSKLPYSGSTGGQADQASDKPDVLVVDVRRTDYDGGSLAGSLNLPAQSFWWHRDTLYRICEAAGIKKVVFFCGSSNGRGPRCAKWFQDFIDEQESNKTSVRAVILKGGIKGWVKKFGGSQMVGFDEKHWKQFN